MSTPLPGNVEAIVYYCHACKSKSTFGRDYFTQVGTPDKCGTCGTPFLQEDRITRLKTDTFDDLSMKRDDLFRKRGENIPVREKPQSPEEIKQQRIKDLENEIKRLKGETPDVPGVRLGP